MAEIAPQLKALKEIIIEKKRLSLRTRELNLEKKQLEEQIIEYLQEKDQPAIKCGSLIFMTKTKQKKIRMKEKEKVISTMEVLKQSGVKEPEELAKEILNSMQGEKVSSVSLFAKEEKS